MQKKKFDSNTKLQSIPPEACLLEAEGELQFAEGKKENRVQLTLYDGGITEHWYWGKLAFDLEGISLAKSRIPILSQHDPNARLGFSTGASFDKRFILEGTLLSNDLARQIHRDAKEGFPFEASLRFDRIGSNIEFVKDGESASVNGRTLEGPGTVVRKCRIMEGSVCVFGALQSTVTEFSAEIADLKATRPEIYSRIFADGEAAERAMFEEIFEICGDDHQLAAECYREGCSKEATLQRALAAREKELADLNSLQKRLGGETQATRTAAAMEFADDAERHNTGKDQADDEKTKQGEKAYQEALAAGRITIKGESPAAKKHTKGFLD